LQGVVAWRADHNGDHFLFQMKAAHKEYLRRVNATRFTEVYDLSAHDVRFGVLLATEYLKHAPSEPLSSTDPPSGYLAECSCILEELCRRVPGSCTAQLLLARCKYLSGDLNGCEAMLCRLKAVDPNHWPTHLLQCQVALHCHSDHEAQCCLDTVIALNFQIQTTLLFHAIKSRLLESSGLHSEAIELLESAVEDIRLFLEQRNESKQASAQKKNVLFSNYENDENAVILQIVMGLAVLYRNTDQMEKAKQLMATARSWSPFRGQNEQTLIRLSEVRMLLKQGEVDAALASLHCIPSSSVHFTRSRMLMAEIYLKHKRNKKAYLECFEQMARDHPNDVHCQLLLGDSYLNIQRTSAAIHCYEEALMMSGDDEKLSLKFGRALIAAHDYQRAIHHFERTLQRSECAVEIILNLAELYLQIEAYDKAQDLLKRAIAKRGRDTIHDVEANIKLLALFATLYENVRRWEDAKSLLAQCWEFAKKLLAMGSESGKEMPPIEAMAAEMSYRLGSLCLRLLDMPQAEECLTFALEHNAQHERASIEMATLLATKGDPRSISDAEERLKSVLSANRHCEDAVLCLVDISVDRNDLKTGIAELQSFREHNPLNATIVLKLIKLLKRSGQYDAIRKLVAETEAVGLDAAAPDHSAAMHFVRGFVAWHLENDGAAAVRELQPIRGHDVWGTHSLSLMTRIYLFNNAGFSFLDLFSRYSHSARASHIEISQQLLREWKYADCGDEVAVFTFGCMLLMASSNGNGDALDKAHCTLRAICKKYPRHALPRLAFCCALHLKEMPNKAIECATDFLAESGKETLPDRHSQFEQHQQLSLLLAQMKLQRVLRDDDGADAVESKEALNEVQRICCSVLKQDASSSTAWALCAVAAEQQDHHGQALKHWETAWNLQNKNNSFLGYSLSRMLLKVQRYTECIDVGHQVLDRDPDFAEIHNVIDRALAKLRA